MVRPTSTCPPPKRERTTLYEFARRLIHAELERLHPNKRVISFVEGKRIVLAFGDRDASA